MLGESELTLAFDAAALATFPAFVGGTPDFFASQLTGVRHALDALPNEQLAYFL
jgi:hypothetical protein